MGRSSSEPMVSVAPASQSSDRANTLSCGGTSPLFRASRPSARTPGPAIAEYLWQVDIAILLGASEERVHELARSENPSSAGQAGQVPTLRQQGSHTQAISRA